MKFIFLKILLQFTRPITCFLALIIISIILLQRQKIKAAKSILYLTLIIIFLSSTPAFNQGVTSYLENQFKPIKINEAPEAQAIVVLGGTALPLTPPRVQPEEPFHSVLSYAARLFHLNKSHLIIVSGGVPYRSPHHGTRTESSDMKDYLMTFHIPERQIIQENQSRNTEENAIYSARILKELHLRKIILITKAYHMPRAIKSFNKYNLDITPFPTDFKTHKARGLINLLPSAEGLTDFSAATKELLGLLFLQFFS